MTNSLTSPRSRLMDPNYWLTRASEVRAQAAMMKHADPRERLERVAINYESLARWIKREITKQNGAQQAIEVKQDSKMEAKETRREARILSIKMREGT